LNHHNDFRLTQQPTSDDYRCCERNSLSIALLIQEIPMPNAAARANARSMSTILPHPDADLIALADRCIAANERFDVAADAYARAAFASPHDEAEEAEADRIQGAALDHVEELGLPLARMQPSTFDGLLAKAKALKFAIPEGDVMAKIIEEALEEGPFVPEPMSLVLARDLIVLADQKDRERAKAGTAAEIEALAADFEVALEALRPFFYGSGSDDDADVATARLREIARKIVAIPTTDIEMMRLKARIYLWSEGTDFKTFAANNEGDGSSEAVLVSLFRDLGARALDPFLAAPVDPIFAAIAQHIVACDALREAGPRVDSVQAKLDGREVTKADEDAVEALSLDEEPPS
jgi:hypothetical protein